MGSYRLRQSADFWQEKVAEWEQSNLTRQAFCSRHNLSKTTLHRWIEVFQKEQLASRRNCEPLPGRQDFIEIVPALPCHEAPYPVEIIVDGITIRLPASNTSPELLAAYITNFRRACR
jgi:transposase-like protein